MSTEYSDMSTAVVGMFRHVRGDIAVAGAISYLTARTRPRTESDSGTVALTRATPRQCGGMGAHVYAHANQVSLTGSGESK